jgi:cell division septum initiation protein DivIVA
MDESLPVPPLQFPSSSLAKKSRGYDREATEDLFDKVASSYEKLWLECSQLREEARKLQEQIGELQAEAGGYKDQERLLGKAMLDAKRSAAAIEEEALKTAEAIVDEARAEAEQMIEKVEPEAQARAKQIVADAEEERIRLEEEIEHLREFTDDTQRDLSSFLTAALKWHKRSLERGPAMPEAEALEALLESMPAVDPDADEDEEIDSQPRRPPSRRLSPPRLSRPS